ncbi:MAG TPA: pyridoxamine 5'-phosphate oxidase family protein [Candidatus Binatia bacterium]|jgi:uncharacterized pyridoxamine 5'-phosphate oxidase family protein|nr:pyridoxamine 5'-phosphate oxidase family protein [Candidatus Binatia bacterium]
MYDTEDELAALQALLDRSQARMSAYMRTILTANRRLSARQLVTYLKGVKHVAVATVTAAGEPRVAPMEALFVHGRFHLATGAGAARVRHLRRRPGVSLTHFSGEDVAITVHGRPALLPHDHPDVPALEKVYVEVYGSSPFAWATDVLLVRVDPVTMYAHASEPGRFPEGATAPPARPRPVLVRRG